MIPIDFWSIIYLVIGFAFLVQMRPPFAHLTSWREVLRFIMFPYGPRSMLVLHTDRGADIFYDVTSDDQGVVALPDRPPIILPDSFGKLSVNVPLVSAMAPPGILSPYGALWRWLVISYTWWLFSLHNAIMTESVLWLVILSGLTVYMVMNVVRAQDPNIESLEVIEGTNISGVVQAVPIPGRSTIKPRQFILLLSGLHTPKAVIHDTVRKLGASLTAATMEVTAVRKMLAQSLALAEGAFELGRKASAKAYAGGASVLARINWTLVLVVFMIAMVAIFIFWGGGVGVEPVTNATITNTTTTSIPSIPITTIPPPG